MSSSGSPTSAQAKPTLGHAPGESAHLTVRDVGQSGRGQRVRHRARCRAVRAARCRACCWVAGFRWATDQGTSQVDHLVSGQPAVEPRHIGAHRDRTPRHRQPDVAAIGAPHPGEDREHRRLARAIRPDQPVDGSAGYGQVDVEQTGPAVVAGESCGLHDRTVIREREVLSRSQGGGCGGVSRPRTFRALGQRCRGLPLAAQHQINDGTERCAADHNDQRPQQFREITHSRRSDQVDQAEDHQPDDEQQHGYQGEQRAARERHDVHLPEDPDPDPSFRHDSGPRMGRTSRNFRIQFATRAPGAVDVHDPSVAPGCRRTSTGDRRSPVRSSRRRSGRRPVAGPPRRGRRRPRESTGSTRGFATENCPSQYALTAAVPCRT